MELQIFVFFSVSAGLFFGTYDTVKTVLSAKVSAEWYPCIHMFSASVAEVVSCAFLIRNYVLRFSIMIHIRSVIKTFNETFFPILEVTLLSYCVVTIRKCVIFQV